MVSHEHTGHRKRLRQRARTEGLDNFLDYQVLEYALSFVIPYKDVNPLAHNLIKKFGSICGVLEADEESLKEIDGMGEVSAQFLTSIIKIYNYYAKEVAKKVSTISRTSEAVEFASSILKGKYLEELYVAFLTPAGKVEHLELVSSGTNSEAKVSVRKITDLVARYKVSHILVAHNHPKGNSKPSDEDDKFTKALVTTMAINEVEVVDHVVVGEDDCYSYRHNDKIEEYTNNIAEIISKKIAQNRMPYEVDL